MSDAVKRAFLDYSERLRAKLALITEVKGLIFLGSSAATERVDEWSDHDFFVVVRPGVAERFRTDLSWLPDHEQIAFSPRETAHGLKVVYEDGRVLEFAIFEDTELELAAANDFAVPLDRESIATRMQKIAARSVPGAVDPANEWELFLAQLLIGVGRARRGEELAAGQAVRSHSLTHAIGLLRLWVEPETPGLTEAQQPDSLNRFRRFEIAYPLLGERLAKLLESPVEACAKELLQLMLHRGESKLSDAQLHQAFVVRQRLGWRS